MSLHDSLVFSEPQTSDFGPQQLLRILATPGLTDLVANGPQIWMANRGTGFEPVSGISMTSGGLAQLARNLVDLADRHLDLANPLCDVSLVPAQLPQLRELGIESLRVHAVLESAVSQVTLLSIRVHRAGFTSLDALQRGGMFSPSQFGQIIDVIETRQNFLIAGSAGSGKTTLLRAMLAHSPEVRTLVVEDTAELLPIPGHVVGLQARQPNIDGAGAIDLQFLAQQALRMQPQRLVVGEVRGAEVSVLLNSMNTGHAGSAATIHANSPNAVFTRLRGLAQGAGISDAAFEQQVKTAVQKVIFLGNGVSRNVSWIGSLQW